jgi:hypothetical protein
MTPFFTRAYETRFHKVASGWLFRGPKRSGKRPQYLVNDAQKAEILSTLPSTGLIVALGSMVLCLLLAATGAFEAAFKHFYGQRPDGLLSELIPFLMAFIVGLPLKFAIVRLATHRIQGIVADLPQTEERVAYDTIVISLAKLLGEMTWSRMCIPFATASSLFALVVFVDLSGHQYTWTSFTLPGGILALTMACCAVACLSSWSRRPCDLPAR